MTAIAVASVQESQELVRWAFSVGVPAIFGLIGVAVGAWLTSHRERSQRRLAFVEQQLKDFYSPMLGLRNETRAIHELRVRINNTAGAVWSELCEEASQVGTDALGHLSTSRSPEFEKLIEYDNRRLPAELQPAYRQMREMFRQNLWLLDVDTREYYSRLVEFVEVWDRLLANSIPGEVMERLGHSEENLNPFYRHLEQRHDELRGKIARGRA